MALEDQLRKVRDGLATCLASGELEQTAYYNKIHELLVQEGVISRECAAGPNNDLVGMVAGGILPKIPAEVYRGLRADYVGKKGVELSASAKQDVTVLQDLIEATKVYVTEHIGEKAVLESEFNNAIHTYLCTRQEFQELRIHRQPWVEGLTHDLLGPNFNIEKKGPKFNIEKNPEQVGQYTVTELGAALERV